MTTNTVHRSLEYERISNSMGDVHRDEVEALRILVKDQAEEIKFLRSRIKMQREPQWDTTFERDLDLEYARGEAERELL